MDGYGLDRPNYGMANPIHHHDAYPDASPVLPYQYGGGFPGVELFFSSYHESDLDFSESIDDSSTSTHHGGPLPTEYHTATADYTTFGLCTFQYGAGTAGGLAQSAMAPGFATSPMAYHHSRHNSCSFPSAEAPGTSNDNTSPSVDGYHGMIAPCPASTPAPSYFATADPPYLYHRAPGERPGSPAPEMDAIPNLSSAGSSITETPVQPEHHHAAAFTSTSPLPADAAAMYRAANTPRLRQPKHRKSTSISNVPSTSMAPLTGASTGTSAELPPGRLRARIKHKRVENQYRNRLSAQFERLLSVLPADRFHNSDDGDAAYAGDSGDTSHLADLSARIDGKTVTRAEVLDVAARYIEESQL